jgi:hypothetical protein
VIDLVTHRGRALFEAVVEVQRIVECRLAELGQELRVNAERLLGVIDGGAATVGVQRGAEGEAVVDFVVIVQRDTELLEVVDALRAPRGLAASRAAWTAGSNSAIRTAMMAMTTSNSMRVKPDRFIGMPSST